MANAGLSVKERMALLQNNNNNNNNNSTSNNNTTTTTKPASGPIKPTPGVTPKPKPLPSENKAPGIAGLKPVAPSKPAVAGPKSEPSSHKPGTAEKPATANKPPFTASKPALASKPGTGPKPSSSSAISTPTSTAAARADEGGKSNGTDPPLFPKLRPVGGTSPGKVTPPVLPKSPSREPGGGGGGSENAASRPAQPVGGSHGGAGGSDSSFSSSSASSEMPDKQQADKIVSPVKPVSVQERLAAIRRKSSEVETIDPKLKPQHHHHLHNHNNNNNNNVSPTPKPTSSAKSSSVFPPRTAAVSEPGAVNGEKSDGMASPTPGECPGGIKRSDIAKSLTQAADRILRNKAVPLPPSSSAAAAAAATTTAAAAEAKEDPAASGDKKKRGSHLFQRRGDGKKFRQVALVSVVPSQPAPAKPGRIDNGVNLQPFLSAYAAAKQEKLEVDGGKSDVAPEGEGEEDVEELYVEAESTSVTIRGRKGSAKRATSARVSLIPEFTEEEEEFELYTDGASGTAVPPSVFSEPEETYDDCESAVEKPRRTPPPPPQPEEEEPDEIYEPLDEDLPEERATGEKAMTITTTTTSLMTTEPEPSPPPLPSPNLPDGKKARDNKDKEKGEKDEEAKKKDRAKEEAHKKEEKERKKKEEDLKKMRRKFGLSESDEKVGDGVVKNNAGGGVLFSKDLAVVRGETIAILRMDGNPVGKWLAQNEQGKIGFVNSNNIEISTPTIRHLMEGVKHEPAASNEPEEFYEALPEDVDEIYEEV